MKKLIRKISSVLTAAALTLSLSASLASVTAAETEDAASNVIFSDECENLTLLDGATVWTSIYDHEFPDYSGTGFVYLANGTIEFEVEVPEDGMYEINTSYVQILESPGRIQTIAINGKEYTVSFPYADEWTDMSFGIFRLKAGTNTIQLLTKYGYAAYDTIAVQKAVLPALDVDPILSDKNATKETQALMNYLCDVYGNNILSGQQEIYGGGHTPADPCGYSGDELLGYESEFEWINKNFGDYPAIRGFDLMNYNPLYGWDDGSTERIIEWGEKNGIPTVCWHINIPLDFANYEIGDVLSWKDCTYEPNSSFSVANATVEGTKEYEYVMSTIDLLAQELLKVQEAGVPIIFRPYHEAEGNSGVGNAWFWWGQEGAEAYIDLWKQLYTTLTETYDIHNLIWEFNSYTYTTSPAWYPGDEWVDMVGFDKYNTEYNRNDGKTSGPNEDAISSTFYSLVNLTNGKKLVAMPENDTVPSLENILVEKANWLYFCIWYDNGTSNFLSDSERYNDFETLKEMYQSDYCITLSELPDWKNYTSEKPIPTEESTTETTNPEIDFIPGDTVSDKIINVFDAIAMRNNLLKSQYKVDGFIESPDETDVGLMASPYDTDGDGLMLVSDLVLLNKYLLGENVELTYYKG